MSNDFDNGLSLLEPFIDLILFIFEIVDMHILADSDRFDFIFIWTIFEFGILNFGNEFVVKLILKVFLFRFVFKLFCVILSVNVLSESGQTEDDWGLLWLLGKFFLWLRNLCGLLWNILLHETNVELQVLCYFLSCVEVHSLSWILIYCITYQRLFVKIYLPYLLILTLIFGSRLISRHQSYTIN